jgi:predicted Rossmann fold nucleotide-binding protein DprA/Smf involved in DNA uptake
MDRKNFKTGKNKMKKIKDQLITISKSLGTLSKKVEKIVDQVDKLQAPKKAVSAKKTVAKKKVVKKKVAKKPAAKKAAPAKKVTTTYKVFNVIKRTQKGITVKQLKEITKLDSRQLSNALYRLTKKGKIERKSTGAYKKKAGGAGGGRPKR